MGYFIGGYAESNPGRSEGDDEEGEGTYGDNQPDIIEAEDPFKIEQHDEEEQQIGGLDLEEVE